MSSQPLIIIEGPPFIVFGVGPQGPPGGGGGGGSGDVVGPSSAADESVARFDGVTGKLLQASGAKINDSGHLEVTALVLVGPGGIKWRLTLGANYGNGGMNQQWERIA